MQTWRDKANRIIAEMSFDAWHKANTRRDGARYKKHRQYSIPEVAQELVVCLGMHDQQAAELRAKQIFIY